MFHVTYPTNKKDSVGKLLLGTRRCSASVQQGMQNQPKVSVWAVEGLFLQICLSIFLKKKKHFR